MGSILIIPFLSFVLFCFSFYMMTHDMAQMPMTVAFIVSSVVAAAVNRKEKLQNKINIFAEGMGQRDIMVMVAIFILAGAFTATAQAVGSVNAAVRIACAFISQDYMTAGLFVISALVSLAIGTSCGTIAAMTPIAVSLAQTLGLDIGLVLGAVVGGSMFGDNLSVISDTTIAATGTQKVAMRDKTIYNFKIVIGPALLCVLLYLFLSAAQTGKAYRPEAVNMIDCVKIIPYLFLLFLGIKGVNVLLVLCIGTGLNIIIGLKTGMFVVPQAVTLIGKGTLNMAETVIIAMLAGGLLETVRRGGGLDYLIKITGRMMTSVRSCELGICLLTAFTNLFTANNTVAILTVGPVAKEISNKKGLNPKRVASLLDATSCVVQGILPYGAQILIAVSLAGNITPFDIIKTMYYPLLVGISIMVSILFSKK
ncbi:MAG: Na+/H+ antiporter NhaC family protein [Alphaproteobacteria bacterium]|nr:Na+/H+ antiporter NhaC family protein [Alphaproteobacteria bacterium]